jgi:hypothetical protein
MNNEEEFYALLTTTGMSGKCATTKPGEPSFSFHIASPCGLSRLVRGVEKSRPRQDAYKDELVLVRLQAQASRRPVSLLFYPLFLQPTMKFSALPLLLVASASAVNAQIKTVSAVRCFTQLGSSSTAKVATVSRVLTLPLYAQKKRTVTPTKVITPPPVLVTTTG